MNAPSHLAFSVLWGGLWASAAGNQDVAFGLNPLTAQCIVATLAGALAPDLDNQKAPASRALPFLSSAIARRFPHRTLLHSILGLVIASGVVYGLLWLTAITGAWADGRHIRIITQFFACGFLSHLILDTATRRGVPYFWPLLKNPLGYPSFEEDRITSGDPRWELIITTVSLALFKTLIPVIQQGAGMTLANAVGRFPQLREVYLNTVDQDVVIQFEGYWATDKAPVSGRGLILAEEGEVFVVQFAGKVFRLGQDAGDIRIRSGFAQLLDQRPQVRTASFHNATIADILAETTTTAALLGTSILISGQLDSDTAFEVNRPFNDGVFSVAAKTLKMDFAAPADLMTLEVRTATTGKSTAELEQERTRSQMIEDSLLAARSQTADLYERDQLFERIMTMRKEREKLEKEMKKEARADTTVRFSGHVAMRGIPAF